MKYIIFLGIFLFLSCERVYDPKSNHLSSYVLYSIGENQITEGGSYLKDSVGIVIRDNLKNTLTDSFTVNFKVIKGGGNIEPLLIRVTENNEALTKWKLGQESCEQVIRADIYDQSKNLINQINIKSYGLIKNEWNLVPVKPYCYIDDMVSDTINNQTFMISGSTLYKQGVNCYEWDEVQDISSVRTIEMDSNGIIYVGGWHGDLYKSTDIGDSWVECTNPIPGYNGYFELYVTSDNYVWVTAWDHGLYYSTDGGVSWGKNISGIENQQEMQGVYRFSDGTLVSLSSNKLVILKSEDKGQNWEEINTPIHTIKIFVTENDELIAINQENGLTLHKSIDKGQTYEKVFTTFPAFHIWPMKHNFIKYGETYYVSIPGDGVFTTNDFVEFKRIWENRELRYLFIDHNGVLIAKARESDLYYQINTNK